LVQSIIRIRTNSDVHLFGTSLERMHPSEHLGLAYTANFLNLAKAL